MQLDLSRNNLTNVTGLDKCVSLRILNLAYNKISKVSNLEACPDLQRLEL
jgi:Leucine-rich repeat (LRR) protein